MSYLYEITEEEYRERNNLEPLECSNSCPHFDYLNQYCWIAWRDRSERDMCIYGLYIDENKNHVKVNWRKKQ